jgi:hypothetical protein
MKTTHYSTNQRSKETARTFTAIGLIWLIGCLICFILLVCQGCATATQSAESTSVSTDPKTGITSTNHYEVKGKITASGNSKQAIDLMKGSAGKTASIGTSGANQESNQSELIKSLADFMNSLVNAGAQAAKTGAK